MNLISDRTSPLADYFRVKANKPILESERIQSELMTRAQQAIDLCLPKLGLPTSPIINWTTTSSLENLRPTQVIANQADPNAIEEVASAVNPETMLDNVTQTWTKNITSSPLTIPKEGEEKFVETSSNLSLQAKIVVRPITEQDFETNFTLETTSNLPPNDNGRIQSIKAMREMGADGQYYERFIVKIADSKGNSTVISYGETPGGKPGADIERSFVGVVPEKAQGEGSTHAVLSTAELIYSLATYKLGIDEVKPFELVKNIIQIAENDLDTITPPHITRKASEILATQDPFRSRLAQIIDEVDSYLPNPDPETDLSTDTLSTASILNDLIRDLGLKTEALEPILLETGRFTASREEAMTELSRFNRALEKNSSQAREANEARRIRFKKSNSKADQDDYIAYVLQHDPAPDRWSIGEIVSIPNRSFLPYPIDIGARESVRGVQKTFKTENGSILTLGAKAISGSQRLGDNNTRVITCQPPVEMSPNIDSYTFCRDHLLGIETIYIKTVDRSGKISEIKSSITLKDGKPISESTGADLPHDQLESTALEIIKSFLGTQHKTT